MFTDKKNIRQLVALLEAHGITQIVLCPGSRNTPIVQTLADHSGFTCYPVTDERSAGYFALGLALNHGRPAAVCCTSGTALLNLHPAVAEAFYQQIPLVVLSADRPAAWIGQMDGQTVPQPELFRTLVRRSVNLPEIHTEEDAWYCNRLINEALLEVDHRGKGPVHINVPISEPLFRFTTDPLPQVRVIRRYRGLTDSREGRPALVGQLRRYRRRMVVVGQTDHRQRFAAGANMPLCSHFVWLAEHIGNRMAPATAVRNFDTVLYALPEAMTEDLVPELLITYGGHIVSKRLKRFLRQHPPREHWHVSPAGEVVDLFGALTAVVEQEPSEFLAELACLLEGPAPEYPRLWEEHCRRIPQPEFGYSEMAAVGSLLTALPEGCALHLANSSAVRYAQLYPISETVEVCCNRGTSGIEGSLSTAVGYAAASDRLNFIAIGDLSFFYDMNALWNGSIRSNLRILLLNNGGGEIFHTLPGLEMTASSHRFIAANHNTSTQGWAEERGFRYLHARNGAELAETMEIFTRPEQMDRPLLLEVFTDKDRDVELLRMYYHQLKQR